MVIWYHTKITIDAYIPIYRETVYISGCVNARDPTLMIDLAMFTWQIEINYQA